MTKFIKNNQYIGFGIVGIIVVVAAVAVLGGGFLYLRELQRLKDIAVPSLAPAPQAQQQNQEQPTTQAPPAELDTSTWETYRNEQYGFEVRYPKEWSTAKIGIPPYDIHEGKLREGVFEIYINYSGSQPGFVVPILVYEHMEFDSYFQEESKRSAKEGLVVTAPEDVSIAGMRGKRFIIKRDTIGKPDLRYSTFEHNSMLYVFTDEFGPFGDPKLTEAIVSTFKFIK